MLRVQGFHAHIAFLSLPTADLAVARDAERVRQGGHDVPEKVIRRRFVAGLSNFFTLFEPVADSWQMFDNAQIGGLHLVAEQQSGSAVVVNDESAWLRLKELAQ